MAKIGFWKEFKEFISRGNVLDMAIGIIIGGAFTAIITAVVNNILTPLLQMIPGQDGLGALQIILRDPVVTADGSVVAEAVIMDFGVVISAFITFLLTAFVLFLIVRTVNRVRARADELKAKKEAEEAAAAAAAQPAPEPVPAGPTTEELLAEIRDLLKSKK